MTAPHIVIVSPHADDWAFSCAEHVFDQPDARFTIISPMRSIPDDAPAVAQETWNRLAIEHEAACGAVGAGFWSGPFPDDRFGQKHQGALTDWLLRMIDPLCNAIWIPMGIRHPDHIQTAWACKVLVEKLWQVDAYVYEELPYRVERPDLVLPTGASELILVGTSYLARKKALCEMYESQIEAAPELERCIYAPERMWRIR